VEEVEEEVAMEGEMLMAVVSRWMIVEEESRLMVEG
jgi:hypothetical protein